MGQKKNRSNKFKVKHPFCCLCGGEVQTENIEHAPPRILFLEKHRPEGLEVPACDRCNSDSSNADQVAAMFSMIQSPNSFDGGKQQQVYLDHIKKVVKGVVNNTPIKDYFHTEGNFWLKNNGIPQKMSKVKFDDKIYEEYLHPWAVKQTLAYWYDKTGMIFSSNGLVKIRWLTSAEFFSSPDPLELAKELVSFSELKQGKWETSEQFFYKDSYNKKEKYGCFFVALHDGACFFAVLADNENPKLNQDILPKNNWSIYRTSKNRGIYESN